MGKGGDLNIKLIWDKMKSGDEKSLSEIFTFYYSDLYKYGIKIFDISGLVKDSIQDVFMRIWERRNTIGNVQNPKAYLIASVRRKLFANKEAYYTEISKEVLKNEESLNFSFATSEFIVIAEISQQIRNSMVRAINSLPERQRELIFLRFYYNLPYLEIAQVMEVNEQTVRNLMQRALSNLRGKVDRRLWDGVENMDDLLFALFLLFRKKN
jgi:RNA polymerase sigma-70 factor (ECF subfamily)